MNNGKIKAVADIIENIHWELIRYGRMDKDEERWHLENTAKEIWDKLEAMNNNT